MGCEDAAGAGWSFGIAGAALIALVVIAVIAQTPPLREFSGSVVPRRAEGGERATPWLSLLAVPLWGAGAWQNGLREALYALLGGGADMGASGDALGCYALGSAQSAAIVIAIVLLPLFLSAGENIARRSLR